MSGNVNETAIWEKDDGGLARMAAREVGSGGLGFWLYFEAGTKVIDRFGMWVMRRKNGSSPTAGVRVCWKGATCRLLGWDLLRETWEGWQAWGWSRALHSQVEMPQVGDGGRVHRDEGRLSEDR